MQTEHKKLYLRLLGRLTDDTTEDAQKLGISLELTQQTCKKQIAKHLHLNEGVLTPLKLHELVPVTYAAHVGSAISLNTFSINNRAWIHFERQCSIEELDKTMDSVFPSYGAHSNAVPTVRAFQMAIIVFGMLGADALRALVSTHQTAIIQALTSETPGDDTKHLLLRATSDKLAFRRSRQIETYGDETFADISDVMQHDAQWEEGYDLIGTLAICVKIRCSLKSEHQHALYLSYVATDTLLDMSLAYGREDEAFDGVFSTPFTFTLESAALRVSYLFPNDSEAHHHFRPLYFACILLATAIVVQETIPGQSAEITKEVRIQAFTTQVHETIKNMESNLASVFEMLTPVALLARNTAQSRIAAAAQESRERAEQRMQLADQVREQFDVPNNINVEEHDGRNKHYVCMFAYICYILRLRILVFALPASSFGSRSRRDERRGRRGPTASRHV